MIAPDLESQAQPIQEPKSGDSQTFKVTFEKDDPRNPKNFSTIGPICAGMGVWSNCLGPLVKPMAADLECFLQSSS
ncbi:hypothetical protein N7488_010603 [Penicillium malachiteum]|nr:hypothetical protein N7488_010603 [Penicillium malachiteum]